MNRLRIVRRLAQGEATVTELIDHVGLSQPLVSWHLGRLRLAGPRRDAARRPGDRDPARAGGLGSLRDLRTAGPRAHGGHADPERGLVSGSIVTPELRARVRGLAQPIARSFGRLGLSPNQLTFIGFGIAVLAGVAAGRQAWLAAGLLVIFGGVFDLFDGALARATGKVSKLGAFYDSVFDRWGEGVVYVGIAWGCLEAGFGLGAVLATAALTSAVMVSYARAKSESLGFAPGSGMANVGLAPREVRLAILTLALVRDWPQRRNSRPHLYGRVRRLAGLPDDDGSRVLPIGARPHHDPRDDHDHPAHPPRARPGSGGLTGAHDPSRPPTIDPSTNHGHQGDREQA